MRSVFCWNKSVDVSRGSHAVLLVDHCQDQRPKLFRGKLKTYRALKKKSSQVAIGRKGRKNCLVIGMSNTSISRAAAPVFINGPGAWLIDSENIASMMSIR